MSRRPGMVGDDLQSKARRAQSRMRSATHRWVPAPGGDNQSVSGAVLGVSVGIGERVEWVYTVMPDGRRVVTGYDILPMPSLDDFEEVLKNSD